MERIQACMYNYIDAGIFMYINLNTCTMSLDNIVPFVIRYQTLCIYMYIIIPAQPHPQPLLPSVQFVYDL